MKDALTLFAISTPVVVALIVLVWGVLSVAAGFVVGRVAALNERPFPPHPYDHERDG